MTCAVSRRRWLAAAAGIGWAAGTAEFAWARIAPGPRTAHEVATMILTSAAIPTAATAHWLRGLWQHHNVAPLAPCSSAVRAVLFDRDGTLVHDVPYNADPAAVHPVKGAIETIRELRRRGIRTAVVTNQSGVGRGLLSQDDVRRVNERIDELFGGFDLWLVCEHGPNDGCACRKPAPGMVLEAARRFGVRPSEMVLIGDIGPDIEAAAAGGARGVLVPTPATRPAEILAAPLVAHDIAEAVRLTVGDGTAGVAS